MKAAHPDKVSMPETEEEKPVLTMMKEAKELENEKDITAAAKEYEKIITAHKLEEEAYQRLMIIYRKTKNYAKEMEVINKGIKAFEELLKRNEPFSKNRRIKSLSHSLLKALGLVDKKGKPLYQPEPIARWEKRKAGVQSLMRRSKALKK